MAANEKGHRRFMEITAKMKFIAGFTIGFNANIMIS